MSTTVTVATKFGPGHQLQLAKKQEYLEDTPAGARVRTKWVPGGRFVTIRGPGYPNGTIPAGFHARPEIVGGYSLTHGVDKEWWDEWVKQHERDPLVMSKTIFGHEKIDTVRKMALEQAKLQTGFEPMKPDTDFRMPRSLNANVTKIQTDVDDRPDLKRQQEAAA